jgi:hypothetical protein
MESIDKKIVLDYLNNSVGGYFKMCKCGEIVNLESGRDGDLIYTQYCSNCKKVCCQKCFVYLGKKVVLCWDRPSYSYKTYSCLDCEPKKTPCGSCGTLQYDHKFYTNKCCNKQHCNKCKDDQLKCDCIYCDNCGQYNCSNPKCVEILKLTKKIHELTQN